MSDYKKTIHFGSDVKIQFVANTKIYIDDEPYMVVNSKCYKTLYNDLYTHEIKLIGLLGNIEIENKEIPTDEELQKEYKNRGLEDIVSFEKFRESMLKASLGWFFYNEHKKITDKKDLQLGEYKGCIEQIKKIVYHAEKVGEK